MARSSLACLVSAVLLCSVLSASAARFSRSLRGSGSLLADDLEAMRLRLVSSAAGIVEAQTGRSLKTAYAYPSGGYGYYGAYYGYYSGSTSGANLYPMRRSLLSQASSGRSLLQSYPYAGAYGYYYGSYGYAAYGSAPYSSMAGMAMRRLSQVERLTELLGDNSDGFVEPGSEAAAARRSLLQAYPYASYGGGYYGYGYYGYASTPYSM